MATRAEPMTPRKGARIRASRNAGRGVRRRATACRRCPSSVSWSTGTTGIVSQPPIVIPARDLEATFGLSRD